MNKIRTYLILLLFCCTIPGYAQVTYFDFQVFTPLPTIDIGAFITANGLHNTSRLFLVTIAPAGIKVKLQGRILWRDVNSTDFTPLLNYVTKEFDSRNFDNTDIGVTDIKTEVWNYDNDSVEKLRGRGKPVGTFRFIVNLLLPDGSNYPGLSEITRDMFFPNTAQTISIISPPANSSQDPTNVLAQWTQAMGASEYLVKVGVRTNPSQSLEEALNSGVPLANNVSVGLNTSVNLFTCLERQWLPTQEIVFQITAFLPSPGGGERLYSDIISFKFFGQEPLTDTLMGTDRSSRSSQRTYSIEELKRIFAGISRADLQNFLNNCGEILEIVDQDGKVISGQELQRILDYLKQNPNAIIDIVPELKSSNPNKSEDTK